MLMWSRKLWTLQPLHETYGMQYTKAYVWQEVKFPQINLTNNGDEWFLLGLFTTEHHFSVSILGGVDFAKKYLQPLLETIYLECW